MSTLWITGGQVVDPDSGLNAIRDIAVENGRVAAIMPPQSVPQGPGGTVVDAAGCLVTPGLIDMHAHVFEHVTEFSVPPEVAGYRMGVTTVVDGGSAGCLTAPAYAHLARSTPLTRLYGFLDASLIYLGDLKFTSHRVGLPTNARNFDADRLVRMTRDYADVIRGYKVRATNPPGESGIPPAMSTAKAAQREVAWPIMVHLGKFPYAQCPDTDELLAMLGPGDIVTHSFRGGRDGILTPTGQIRPAVRAALDRGVLLDVGQEHSLNFEVVQKALDQGVSPYTLSTDLAVNTIVQPDPFLVDVMTKFVALGMDMADVVAAVTAHPAALLRAPERGRIRVGDSANLTVLERLRAEDGAVTLRDNFRHTLRHAWRLWPRMTIVGERIERAMTLTEASAVAARYRPLNGAASAP